MQTRIWIQLQQHADTAVTARWCLVGSADDSVQCADFEAFKHWLEARKATADQALRAVLLLSGVQVVNRSLSVDANEKKHLQKLLPFMLESQLAVDLSQIHVAHRLSEQTALVAYSDRKQLQWHIDELEGLGLEVELVCSLPALLPASDSEWSMLLDSDLCHLHAGSYLCTSAEPALIPALLEAAVATLPTSHSVHNLTVFWSADNADNAHNEAEETAHALAQLLSEHDAIKAAGIKVVVRCLSGHLWTSLRPDQDHVVNLRQGEFAAPLRLDKYWQQWRVPAIAAVVAVTTVLLATAVETQLNQTRFRTLQTQIEQRYREVMPEGVLVDAEQQLAAQVSQRRNNTSAQSLTGMLNTMLDPIENAEGVTLHRLSYNASDVSGTEIQLNISAPGTSDILQLSEDLTAAGWSAQAQNISRVGDIQQANLIVRGK